MGWIETLCCAAAFLGLLLLAAALAAFLASLYRFRDKWERMEEEDAEERRRNSD